MRNERNIKVLQHIKETDFEKRKKPNPENNIKIEASETNDEVINFLIKDKSETLNWEKASHLIRHTSDPPPINLENIDEILQVSDGVMVARESEHRSNRY